MRIKALSALLAAFCLFAMLSGCGDGAGSASPSPHVPPSPEGGQIYLCGEYHGEKPILEKELERWGECYESGMRQLFIEYPYYTAQFMNLWMADEGDDIFDAVYADWEGTLAQDEDVAWFFGQVKALYPETVFHGTDVGHQYDTTGARYLEHLRRNGLEDTEEYRLAAEAVEQGRQYYKDQDDEYREAAMTENFIREFEALEGGGSVMGIYGAFHTEDSGGKGVERMAERLRERYGEALHTEDLSYLCP